MTGGNVAATGGDVLQVIDFIEGGNAAETRQRPCKSLISLAGRRRQRPTLSLRDKARARALRRARFRFGVAR
jgi:hypothetical protein